MVVGYRQPSGERRANLRVATIQGEHPKMAERSGRPNPVALALIGLGALLLVAALLIPTYTLGRLEKIPLDLETTTVSTGEGRVLDAASLTTGTGPAFTENVPLISQRFLTVEEPSNADVVTLQAGSTLRRTDRQGDSGLLTASVDRVTVDRSTSMPVEDPVGTIQVVADQPAAEVPHTGLQYKFPFNVEQTSYPFFDLVARESFPLDFVEETEINGLPVYHFRQEIGPIDLAQAVPSVTANSLELPAAAWGLEGDAPVRMDRYYSNVREVWVEPRSGTIVRGQEQPYQFYARDAATPDVDVLRATLAFDENTVERHVQIASDAKNLISLVGRTVPIIAAILGVLSLIGGIFLLLRSGRTPKEEAPQAAAATDGYGFGRSGYEDETVAGRHGYGSNAEYESGDFDYTRSDDQPSTADYSDDLTEEIPRTRLRGDQQD